ncbi:deoxyribose-phosphate aldolase [Actinopolyspora mortivallis]|uniref:Deoxyribose-phosphate aldolase n=1 Tax=Actinopolyspora mortivallis TaxID=33906 RepID=A0A2T0GXF4_ACTMO|nr:deoxyribose-phosphate aldolase [Actinopolyspora mortivallis]PRW63784.1 deoxyribose-phosphate aldolase [Actinopolyspora mortivallis]
MAHSPSRTRGSGAPARLPTELAEAARGGRALESFLRGLPGVDAVGLEQRAAALGARGVGKDAKLRAIDTAIGMVDLTTLEGADTPGKVRALAAKARHPDPGHSATPRVAALCVYPDLVAEAVSALGEVPVGVASVATAFPSGRSCSRAKLAEVELAVDAGADEVDMVIDRGAFLSGRYGEVFDEIREVRAACGGAHLKVILETGELGTYDNVQRASWLALLAGADFVKTSTGKVSPAATLPVTHVLLRAVREWYNRTGQWRGVKPAGGIRTTKDALRYLVAVREVAGPEWLTPRLFRFGASGLLNDLLMQRRTQLDGHYGGPDHVAVDL